MIIINSHRGRKLDNNRNRREATDVCNCIYFVIHMQLKRLENLWERKEKAFQMANLVYFYVIECYSYYQFTQNKFFHSISLFTRKVNDGEKNGGKRGGNWYIIKGGSSGCLPLKVVLHRRSCSTKCRFPPQVVFHQKSSSNESRLPPKVIFHERSSSTEGCLLLDFTTKWTQTRWFISIVTLNLVVLRLPLLYYMQ